jgi:hypothetical protein
MDGSNRSSRLTLALAAVALVSSASPASAQRQLPRLVVAPQPRAPRTGTAADNSANDPRRGAGQNPGWNGQGDPRHQGPWTDNRDPRHQGQNFDNRDPRRQPRTGGPSVIYVVPPGYGYGYAYGQGAYYPPQPYYGSGVYDANGRPLYASADGQGRQESFSYTPDLSGSPYSVTDEGMMVVDFADADRRAFPSCAGAVDARDPQGRPRTVFYQPTDYWMVLRPGQRGRVQGMPPAGVQACYAVDSAGRVVLRY